ncbi:serine hydrolase domain-containing protein [Paractinoplanes atraurantiacus]|uniref:D-alanyl-D-alanine carboxypeptidase n=1 Tax=Paractinoplanes atraurantiacus TaxID=1036182 RepID=A0A285IU80_9ACTN|nr:serine hydrolase domain-containing protein [Actinoplanes atraurantiacus]SNY51569.1 D-alanyl-D-alanine carboxypeptidase [Actinoplanes atraurantiacus]
MRKRLAQWGVATALVATLVAGAAGPAAAAASQNRHGDQRLQAAADDLHRLGITGVQALSRVDGRTGRALAGDAPADGYFRMGSNTKTFLAVVVLQLAGERRLSLDDTVDHWLPGVVSGNGNDGRRITLRQLLQHTSGLYNYTNTLEGLDSYEGYLAHRRDHYDLADLVALAMKHEPVFAPGTSWDYSNTNYILAGMIVEKATGRPWPAEVTNRIIRPLGLRHTSYPGDRATLPAPHAKAHQQWTPDGPLYDTTILNPTVAASAGGLITTPADLARFWQALQQGRLLAPRQMADMHRTVPAETWQDGTRYGLGIEFIPNRCGGYWAHGGDVPGSHTANAVSPNGKRVVVLSLTTQPASGETQQALQGRINQLADDVICGSK